MLVSTISNAHPPRVHGVRLIASGCGNQRIAEELYITLRTAGTHVSDILTKLGASRRTEAAAIGSAVSDPGERHNRWLYLAQLSLVSARSGM